VPFVLVEVVPLSNQFTRLLRVMLVRIPHSEFDKLACQAESVGIFAFLRIPSCPLAPTWVPFVLVEVVPISNRFTRLLRVMLVRIPHSEFDKLACQAESVGIFAFLRIPSCQQNRASFFYTSLTLYQTLSQSYPRQIQS